MSNNPLMRCRPQGMESKRLKLKQTSLKHPDVPKVIETVIRAAFDESHENQTEAQKIPTNSLPRISAFEIAVAS